MKALLSLPLLFSSILLLTACDTKSSDYFNQQNNGEVNNPEQVVVLPHGPVFDPANKKIPTTNDLLMGADGTLNYPNAPVGEPGYNPVIAAINELDGFSTSNPITIDFGMPIDKNSLVIGESVHVLKVIKDPQTGAITRFIRSLTPAEIIAVPSGNKLAIVPRIPLKESSSYLVLLTDKIKDTAGVAAEVPSTYNLIKSTDSLQGTDYEALEGLRLLTNNMETIGESQGVSKDSIIMSWSFTTQSISAVLNAVAADAKAGKIVMAPIGMNTKQINAALPGIADISIGTLDVPYYLEAPSTTNPFAPLTSYWKDADGKTLTRNNTIPKATSTLTIPVIMTIPNANSGHAVAPAGGWPLIMYQHGITRMRSDILAYADTMAAAGFAVIAIDLPLHGVPKFLNDDNGNLDTTKPNPFHTSKTPFPSDIEPSFDVDYANNITNASGQDGLADASGKHFMNLQSLLTSRDNIRQGVSNLLVLRRSIKDIPNINANKIGFIAHSLGGIVGVPYLAVEDKSLPSSLVAAGVGIRNILKGSIPFGVDIKNGLAAAGIAGQKYEDFMYAAQFVLDSADPLNYAADAATSHSIHIVEIIGDKVVPNSTTEHMVALMQAKSISTTTTDITAGRPGIVRFTQGIHSSVLSPTHEGTSFLNVYTEIHKQLGAFQATAGSTIVISDKTIIQ